jgi:trk system potassium uptake protein TrkH
VFGALPYVATGALDPVDALFESVAGFTTTAASALPSVEAAPRALLLWRSLSQWLGGLATVFVAIAMLPLFGIGGMQLFPANLSRTGAEAASPRLVDTARRIAAIYGVLSGAACLCLWAAGMAPFDAICHGLATVATGGFSTRDASIGAFDSPAVEWVMALFMLIAATSFASLQRLATGDVRRALADAELRYYAATALVATALVLWTLRGQGEAGDGLRAAVFQVASVLSGTGFHTADFAAWPPLAQFVLVACMILGGMAGSPTGGIKSLRLLLGMRALGDALLRLLHPRVIRQVKYAGRTVPDEVLAGVWSFFTAFFLLVALTAAALAAAGHDLVTSISLAFSTAANVGPALGEAGPGQGFAAFPGGVKLVLLSCMLAGRLEVFALLVLFRPGFWRR